MTKSFWQEYVKPPAKPKDVDYAFIVRRKPEKIHETTAEKLPMQVRKYHRNMLFVTTKEMDEFEIVGADPDHMQSIIDQKMQGHYKALAFIAAVTLLFVVALLYMYRTSNNFWLETAYLRVFGAAFGLIPLIGRFFEMWQLRSISCDNGEAEMEDIRFRYWLSKQRKQTHWYLPILLMCCFFAQEIFGRMESIMALGLVKEATRGGAVWQWGGEYWRLFTSMFLHGDYMHVLFNSFACYALGHIFLSFFSFQRLLIVCLFAGLIGGLGSMVFYPVATSVGASGAILGILGYLMVVGLRFRKIISWNFTTQMIWIAVSMAIIGLAGFDFIDNAAHGGGLLGGMILALFASREALVATIDGRSAEMQMEAHLSPVEREEEKS